MTTFLIQSESYMYLESKHVIDRKDGKLYIAKPELSYNYQTHQDDFDFELSLSL